MNSDIKRLQSVYDELSKFLLEKGVDPARLSLPAPTPQFKLRARSLKDMKVACIMDAFTYLCYDSECSLFQLTPENWQSEIEAFEPDMLFVESAWLGKDGLWHRKIAHGSQELYALSQYCKEKKIPVVFWCKEDPVYTNTFMRAASMADIVFTCDIDAISKYKAGTGNNHVYHLHFAAQPTIHNPIETMERKDKFCFAGAYYHRYPVRSQVFDSFSDYFIANRGIDIYDRNFGNALPEHKFPERYDPYILGTLMPSEIDKAYKGYHFGINMNSVSQSQTMFARRIFELMASNTIVVGNYSHGAKNYFGDLTISTDRTTTLNNELDKYCGCDLTMRKYRLKGLRRVLSEHLYEDRLSYIVEKVFGEDIKPSLPKVAVVAYAENTDDEERIIELFNSQCYGNKELYLISDEEELNEGRNSISKYAKLCEVKADYVAYFAISDYYGANYLIDLALSTRFLDDTIDGIGKAAFYNESGFIDIDKAYTYVPILAPCRSMFKTNSEILISQLLDNAYLEGNYFSIDEFNYLQKDIGIRREDVLNIIEDLHVLDEGISLQEIQNTAENVPMSYMGTALTLTATDAAALFDNNAKSRGLSALLHENALNVDCALKGDAADYLYFGKYYTLSDVCEDGSFHILFDSLQTDIMGLVIIFYDKNKQKKESKFLGAGCSASYLTSDELISESTYFRLALRFKGVGSCVFKEVKIGLYSFGADSPPCLLKSDTLILSNIYPSYDNLYRNMFVHSRVKAYQRKGFLCDVMCSNIYAKDEYREIEGVQVIDGRAQMLADVINSGKIKTVCVHFLDEQMFTVLKSHLDNLKIVVWVHGSEIQPWWRREYNFTGNAELERAKVDSEKRMAFWKEVFAVSKTKNIHFVFVSHYFADEVMEDYKVQLSKDKYSIIHNGIDTKTFNYIAKDAEQRKKIFSCRPFASRKYANDLSVKAIQHLSKRKEFSDMHFNFSGSGEMFSEITAPLRRFKNVTLEERHYTHEELATLHKEYGICLTPTRMDAQGVSRDEAMSSGLVPITNAVAAIPEFVDDECGILVSDEDWQGLADGILKLYHDAELFLRLSSNAADRVREQSDIELMMDKELGLIK